MFEIRINNLYSYVNRKKLEEGEADAISELLAAKVPGYWFSPKYKKGLWDGTVKFYHRGTGAFYTGLLGYVKANLNQFEFVEIDERKVIPHQNNSINLKGIELRDYQKQTILQAVEKGRGIIASPTNSGKTEVACGIIQVLGLPANLITHRRRLLWQTKKRFEERLGIEIGVVGDQVQDIKDINILSIQTIAKRLKDEDPIITNLLKNTPVVISDECHRITAVTWEKCLKACKTACYRYGLSATPLMRGELNNMKVLGLTGDEIVTVTDQELTEWGFSAYPSVYLKEIKEPKFPRNFPYDRIYEEGVIFNSYRNKFIAETAKHWIGIGKTVFIIVFRISHGEEVTKWVKETGIETEFISGKSKTNDDVLDRFSDRKLSCVVSSTISDEGLDLPAIDVLIIAVEDESALKVVQRVGRGRRKKLIGENVLIVVDFIHTNNKALKKHGEARLEQYVKMGMELYEVCDENWKNIVKL